MKDESHFILVLSCCGTVEIDLIWLNRDLNYRCWLLLNVHATWEKFHMHCHWSCIANLGGGCWYYMFQVNKMEGPKLVSQGWNPGLTFTCIQLVNGKCNLSLSITKCLNVHRSIISRWFKIILWSHKPGNAEKSWVIKWVEENSSKNRNNWRDVNLLSISESLIPTLMMNYFLKIKKGEA